ncbi:hypothetical protein BCR34DRAFT_587838 [Clohesyomyces aquaticus]|uniref:F-box domain-containing protein n=1 Tax=Clohesyomyces aquaticus TaxID=1231657 RepID=A0A1Y1ZNV5_9PLEO|nr:hypothetical protein BCR34DRAFT_587838 [Clohesyomyces aquaticus]
MARSLLSLPPEILLNILHVLPIPSLLKFSQTCRFSHDLAISNLHTLSMGIYPSRMSCIVGRLAATRYPLPKTIESAFSLLDPLSSAQGSNQSSRSSSVEPEYPSSSKATFYDDNDPFRVSIVIPDAHQFDFMTLVKFHTALTQSVLSRHCATLRTLDLSLWTLSTPIANALSRLPALRALSLRIEDLHHVRPVPRTYMATSHIEQDRAWDILSTSAGQWASRLDALRIENAEVGDEQLIRILSQTRRLGELWLYKCSQIDVSLWSFLGSEWEGRTGLRVLAIMHSGTQLDEEVLDVISTLDGLQYLNLQGCHGLDEEVAVRNRDYWRIPEFVPPHPQLEYRTGPEIIEVDPAYMENYDESDGSAF